MENYLLSYDEGNSVSRKCQEDVVSSREGVRSDPGCGFGHVWMPLI